MEYQLYINGEWKDTVTGYVAEDKNPADDSVFARVHFAGGAEVEEAIAGAPRSPAYCSCPKGMEAVGRHTGRPKGADSSEGS